MAKPTQGDVNIYLHHPIVTPMHWNPQKKTLKYYFRTLLEIHKKITHKPIKYIIVYSCVLLSYGQRTKCYILGFSSFHICESKDFDRVHRIDIDVII